MCGIAGIFGLNDEKIVRKMLVAQAHRGPDGKNIWGDPINLVTLGHVRLSILDVSSNGTQPMEYGNERLHITYNGEIYNFREIRLELMKLGYEFKSDSDTEVILASYLEWGTSCVRKFRGMFAFVIFDKSPKIGCPNLFLVRDRLGIKPLHYFKIKNKIFFASEIRALLATGCIERRIDREAILDYFSHGAVYEPNTIIKGIQSLPAGHYLEIFADGSEKLSQYWDLHDATVDLRKKLKGIKLEEAIPALRKHLEEATKYALTADVEVGAFLSGGIDSTAVVGLMSKIGAMKVKTYALGFEEKLRSMDERQFAKVASNHLNTDHTGIVATTNDSKEIFYNVVRDLDQPSIDGMNTWIVSKTAATNNKVVLSGLGGDEIFAGYPHFFKFSNNKISLKFSFLKKHIERLHRLRPNFLTIYFISKLSTPIQQLTFIRTLFYSFQIEETLRPCWTEKLNIDRIERSKKFILRDADRAQQMTYFELNAYLKNMLLRDSDVMSMAHGLELRPLLLDHVLVEFVYSLPEKLKLSPSIPKKLFVDAILELLPDELKKRKKMGFELPFVEWMKGPLKDDFIELLKGEYASWLLTPEYISLMIKKIENNRPPWNLWGVAVLLSWLEQNQIERF
jgi:asparagine synthase (glutamine-hydrolysing)